MNNYKKLLYKILYCLRLNTSISIAQKIGVKFPNGTGKSRVLDDPMHVFGSEPYLVTIGKNVEITNDVRFITHDGGCWVIREIKQNPKIDFLAPIVVGNNVFIGLKSIILPGVHIGNNVVIGAGSVVTKDIPDNSVAAGVPCRVIKNIDDYCNNKLNSVGICNSKGLSYQDKYKMIKDKYPQYFVVDGNGQK